MLSARGRSARRCSRRACAGSGRRSARCSSATCPGSREEGETRYHDRDLATAVLFDMCPGGKTARSVELLAEEPAEMGFSYPANAVWRLWALIKANRIDVVLNDLRTRWAGMESVSLNNTLQEGWHANPDNREQWSHCPIAPLIVLQQGYCGYPPRWSRVTAGSR